MNHRTLAETVELGKIDMSSQKFSTRHAKDKKTEIFEHFLPTRFWALVERHPLEVYFSIR